MPIKEIIALSAAVLVFIAATHPTRPREAIRELQVKILREVGRTDNWGNPSIFPAKPTRSAPFARRRNKSRTEEVALEP